MLTVGVFSKFFPNITSLLYERYSLIKLIPAIEEGELSDDDLKVVTDEDLCLYDFAERLSKFGLRLHDDSKFFQLINDSDDEYLNDGAYDDFFIIDNGSWQFVKSFFYEEIFSKIKK